MTKRAPLAVRLYFEPHLSELARLIGYAGVHKDEAREPAKLLLERFGREKMEAAQRELLDFNQTTNRFTLKPAVRAACWQLLGPPPEQRDHFERPAQAPPPLSANGTSIPPRQRTRRRGGAG